MDIGIAMQICTKLMLFFVGWIPVLLAMSLTQRTLD